ncbi:MAG: peptide ABC transporter substrate-binding protein [Clostridia bacterium]|nr:peptide ABC transporter substrate-binding protein [Clostridia bacterium]
MRKKLLCLMLALCLIATCLCGCGKKNKDDGKGGGFRFPIAAEPTILDPQMAQDDPSVTVLCALFEGLTRLDSKGKAVPAAADWKVSEDGLTYTFTLKESYWNAHSESGNSQPWKEPMRVTADDFLFGIQRIADPATGSPLTAELTGILNAEAVIKGEKPLEELGVKVVDKTHLTITLSAPDSDFPARLATSPFFPCHRAFFTHSMGRYGLEEEYVLSNGAFRLAAWNHGENLLLYKHNKYHDAAAIAPEAVRFVIGNEDPLTALKEGDLSAAPLTAAQAASAGKGIRTTKLDDTVRSLWFNTTAAPLNEVAIRHALRDSIQWDSVNNFVKKSGETIAKGYIPPAATVRGNEIYRTDKNALAPTTKVDAAKQSLQKGLTALEVKAPDRLRIEVLTAKDATSTDIARYIVQSWQKNLGITVTLTLVSEQDLAKRVRNGNYQVALYTHTPTGLTGAENLSAFASTAPDNFARLKNDGVDTAVTAALLGGRDELTALEQAVWQACPAIPISFPCRYYGFAKNTADIVARPFGGGRYQSPLDFRNAKQYD